MHTNTHSLRQSQHSFGKAHTPVSRRGNQVPQELLFSAKERNSKLKLQNFKIYQELRKNMEKSIQRQRKALKHSILQYVPSLQPQPNIHLKRTLTELPSKRRSERKPRRRNIPGYKEATA